MTKQSAGILPIRFDEGELEIFLVHPGGPFWAKKDRGAWSISKGLIEKGEDALNAAKREFREETGQTIDGEFIELGDIRQPSGKIVHVWAVKNDMVSEKIISNTFSMKWPKNSGVLKEFPEIDRAGWFGLGEARIKIHRGQREFIDRLIDILNHRKSNGSKQTTLI